MGGQDARGIVDEVEAQIILPLINWRLPDDFGEGDDGGVLAHDDVIDRGDIERRQHDIPGQAGGRFPERRCCDRIVRQVAVAPLFRLPVRGRDFFFQRIDRRRPRARIVKAGKVQHGFDVAFIGGAFLGKFCVEIIGPVRHAEAGLRDVDRVFLRRLGVDGNEHRDRRGGTEGRVCKQGGNIGRRFGSIDRGEIGLQRRKPGSFDGIGIHECREISADLAFRRRRVARLRRRVFNNSAHALLRPIAQDGERAIARIIGWHFKRVHPAPADITEEVVARIDRRVHVGRLNTPGPEFGTGCGFGGRRCFLRGPPCRYVPIATAIKGRGREHQGRNKRFSGHEEILPR